MKVVTAKRFNDRNVAFAREGWFNGTEMAAACGEEIAEWVGRPGMQDRFKAMARRYRVAGGKVVSRSRKRTHSGVWLHPCLVDTLGAWLGDDAAKFLEEAVESVKRDGDRLLTRSLLDREYLLKCLAYDPESGLLVWRADRPPAHFPSPAAYIAWRDQKAGSIAGWPTRLGYLKLSLDGAQLWQHHVVLAMHGIEVPDGMEVDHLNGNPADNRLENLRVVDRATNMRNTKMRSNNTSGVNGVMVYRRSKPFMAMGTADGKKVFLGNFATIEQAAAARKAWERKIGGFTERHGMEG